MPLLGAHMSIAGGLHKSLLRGEKAGCQVIQIFTKNRNRWEPRALSIDEIAAFHKTREETSITPVAAHTSYLINLASPRSEVSEKSLHALLDELLRSELLKIPYLVETPKGVDENGVDLDIVNLNLLKDLINDCI